MGAHKDQVVHNSVDCAASLAALAAAAACVHMLPELTSHAACLNMHVLQYKHREYVTRIGNWENLAGNQFCGYNCQLIFLADKSSVVCVGFAACCS